MLSPIQTIEIEAALCGAGDGPIWYSVPLLTGEGDDEDVLGDRTGLATGAATWPIETGKRGFEVFVLFCSDQEHHIWSFGILVWLDWSYQTRFGLLLTV